MGGTGERVYGQAEIVRILSLSPKRAAQLRRLDLLRGDTAGYGFRDLLALRAASALLDAGASVRQIKDALAALRRRRIPRRLPTFHRRRVARRIATLDRRRRRLRRLPIVPRRRRAAPEPAPRRSRRADPGSSAAAS